jgi:predicted nucleic acid-binding protein
MRRIFLDSSVLFAGAYSNKGYARDLIVLGIREQVNLCISSLVIEETRRNLAYIAPEIVLDLERIFELVAFEVINPSKNAVISATGLVALKDAPILAAARLAKVDILVTLDKRHLLDRPELEVFIGARILRPKQSYEWILSVDIGGE